MAGLNDLLNLSSSGLSAYQSQINVYGNNIANVNTEGYSRRTLSLETGTTLDGYGTGVRTGDVARLYNALGNSALLQEQSSTSYNSELASYLSELETLIGSDGAAGFDTALSDFQDALQDAIASPGDLAARTALLQRAASVAAGLNTLDIRTSAVLSSDGMLGSPDSIVGDINAVTEQLQTINRSIAKSEAAGRSVPELLDSRDNLVRELSKQVNISVGPDYEISLGGQVLVSANGQLRNELLVEDSNTFTVGGADVSGSISGGKLAGMLSAQVTARTLSGQLDTLAATLIDQVNSIFDNAYNLKGERPADLGYTFFAGSGAGDIALDPALYNPNDAMNVHPELVALAATTSPGDNAAAQSLYDVLQRSQAALGGQSISTFWSHSETTLGGALREARQLAASGQSVVDALNGEMLSVSGVNLDEELMNLMSAQNAYQACARIMSTANDLLNEVINLIR